MRIIVAILTSLWIWAQPVTAASAVGEVVAKRGQADVRVALARSWAPARTGQTLAAGDTLRTGAYGLLAVALNDRTVLRMHPDSELTLDAVRDPDAAGPAQSPTVITLARGALWSRALAVARAATAIASAMTPARAVEIRAVNATLGIRGTDWYVKTDPRRTEVVVLSGAVELANALGAVTVVAGEQGIADAGSVPVKRVLVDLRDRPLLLLEFRPVWFELLNLTPAARYGESLAERSRLGALAARSPGEVLALAALQYDTGRLAAAARTVDEMTALGAAEPALAGRAWLLRGALAARRGAFEDAERHFAAARAQTHGRDRDLTALAEAAMLGERGEFTRMAAALDAIERTGTSPAEVTAYRAALLAYRGDYDAALKHLAAAEPQFPSDPRLPTLRAALSLLTGAAADMREALARALEIDPDYPLAWSLRGLYHHDVEPDAQRALDAYRRSLELYPDSMESWNNLALVYSDLGDRDGAARSIRAAIDLLPGSVLPKANLGGLLLVTDDLAGAAAQFEAAERLRPGHPGAVAGRGLLALARGTPGQAVTELTKAIAADPAQPEAPTLLAAAHYQAGAHEAALGAIDAATRFDPDDPVAPLVASIMAQDQAEAGLAIRYAQIALDRARRYRSFAVEDLANTQSGITNLGSAYANLGLEDWGEYYAQSAFTPYAADGYFFLSDRYRSARGQQAAAGQGLLLDPTAVSAPTRYFEFVRAPRTDVSVLAGSGYHGGVTHTGGVSVQGYARLPAPVSYALSYSREHDNGFRANGDSDTQSFVAGAGLRLDEARQHLVFLASGTRSRAGVPGMASASDPDDDEVSESLLGSLGWHYRFNYANRVLARIAGGYGRELSRNARPFGSGLSEIDYSLVARFGVEPARRLLQNGLYDASAFFGFPTTDPILLSDPVLGPLLGPRLPADLPGKIDTKPARRADLRTHQMNVQVRHLLDLGPVEATYGLEYSPQWRSARTRANEPVALGSGLVIPDLLAFFANPDLADAFVLASPLDTRTRRDADARAAQVYAQARWRPLPGIWAEAGLFGRWLDDDLGTRTGRLDPRIGFAWQPGAGHWLRAAWQRELGLPVPVNGSLAPVATVGFDIDDTLLLADGARATDLRLRWDAQWLANAYSFLEYGDQRVDEFALPLESSFDAFTARRGRVRSATAGVNLWFLERFGFAARYRRQWSDGRTPDGDDGSALPLVARHGFDASLTWVHPRQIRVSAGAHYVGTRNADLGGIATLDDYWTLDIAASWEPRKRHWLLTARAINVLDEEFDLARDIPAPGATVAISAEYRF